MASHQEYWAPGPELGCSGLGRETQATTHYCLIQNTIFEKMVADQQAKKMWFGLRKNLRLRDKRVKNAEPNT